MNKITKTSVAVVTLLLTALSSVASESQNASGREPKLAAPTIITQKAVLDAGELVKYQQLGVRSQQLAGYSAAGASKTTKTVLITVGVVLVVAIVVVAVEASAASSILASGG